MRFYSVVAMSCVILAMAWVGMMPCEVTGHVLDAKVGAANCTGTSCGSAQSVNCPVVCSGTVSVEGIARVCPATLTKIQEDGSGACAGSNPLCAQTKEKKCNSSCTQVEG